MNTRNANRWCFLAFPIIAALGCHNKDALVNNDIKVISNKPIILDPLIKVIPKGWIMSEPTTRITIIDNIGYEATSITFKGTEKVKWLLKGNVLKMETINVVIVPVCMPQTKGDNARILGFNKTVKVFYYFWYPQNYRSKGPAVISWPTWEENIRSALNIEALKKGDTK